MCMNSTTFTTKWCPKEKAWVGIGYKAYDDCVDKSGRVRWERLNNVKPKVWMTAHGNFGSKAVKGSLKADNTVDCYEYMNGYPRAFHIWLKEKDAQDYRSNINGIVVKVLYKNVLAFGTNYCSGGSRDCLISQDMKILEVLDKHNYLIHF